MKAATSKSRARSADLEALQSADSQEIEGQGAETTGKAGRRLKLAEPEAESAAGGAEKKAVRPVRQVRRSSTKGASDVGASGASKKAATRAGALSDAERAALREARLAKLREAGISKAREARVAERVRASGRAAVAEPDAPPPPEPATQELPATDVTEAASEPPLLLLPAEAPPMEAPTIAPPVPETSPSDVEGESAPDAGAEVPSTVAPARRGRGAKPSPATSYVPPPAVEDSQPRARHFGLAFAALLLIAAPAGLTGWYMHERAADQFESQIGFAVRSEQSALPTDVLGVFGGSTSGSTGEDMNILDKYLRSPGLVRLMDEKLDIRSMFSRPEEDLYFRFDPNGTIEDLVDYWNDMVVINYDGGIGLMEVHVFAFAPQDAQAIAAAVMEESGRMVNELSAAAREDATHYAKEALLQSKTRLTEARQAVMAFRIENQIVDPTADIASQMGVLAALSQEKSNAQVELETLRSTVKTSDPRLTSLERRIAAIDARIAEERTKLGIGENSDGPGFAELAGAYENLKVDLEYANQAYLAALAGMDAANADAQRKSRYLAEYVLPTVAEAPTAPDRVLWTALVGLVGFFVWVSSVLIYYALRDRR